MKQQYRIAPVLLSGLAIGVAAGIFPHAFWGGATIDGSPVPPGL